MKKSRMGWVLAMMLFVVSNQAMAAVSAMTPADKCVDLLCVRNNIDVIDTEIVKLIGLRLTYVAKAGELKQGKQAVYDPAREKQILVKVGSAASKAGYSSAIAVAVYKTLLEQTNAYELHLSS